MCVLQSTDVPQDSAIVSEPCGFVVPRARDKQWICKTRLCMCVLQSTAVPQDSARVSCVIKNPADLLHEINSGFARHAMVL